MTRLPTIALALALLGSAVGIGRAAAEEAPACLSGLAHGAEIRAVDVPSSGRLPAGTLLCGWAVATDGDTLELVQDAHAEADFYAAPARGAERPVTIRLFGVSAPEHDAPGGLFARAALDDLLTGGALPDAALPARDNFRAGGPVACVATGGTTYKRPVAVCRVDSPSGAGAGDAPAFRDLGEGLLRLGAAVTFRRYLRDRPALAAAYLRAEAAARRDGLGLWSAIPADSIVGTLD